MKQKTVMVDPKTWMWLKEHRGAGTMGDLINDLIKEHDSSKRSDTSGLRPTQELKDAFNTLNQT